MKWAGGGWGGGPRRAATGELAMGESTRGGRLLVCSTLPCPALPCLPGRAAGSFNGVQGSLQSFCQMLAYSAGVVVRQPERFVLLCAGSCGVVATAACLFTAFAVMTRCGRALGDGGLQALRLVEEEPLQP